MSGGLILKVSATLKADDPGDAVGRARKLADAYRRAADLIDRVALNLPESTGGIVTHDGALTVTVHRDGLSVDFTLDAGKP